MGSDARYLKRIAISDGALFETAFENKNNLLVSNRLKIYKSSAQ